ncbi:MAG: FtsB family cell division protein [Ignavibacteria bacterium]|jgi:cell division protein FtsB
MAKHTNDENIARLKKKRLMWGGIIFAISLGVILFTKYGVIQGWRLDGEKANIQSEIQRQVFVRDSLKRIIQRLHHDDREIERLARERYGMIKPGEEVLFVPQSQ